MGPRPCCAHRPSRRSRSPPSVWPSDGSPEHPAAWLIATARRRAIDRLRRNRTLAEKTKLLAVAEASEDGMLEERFPDERLELVFTCCHPALDEASRSAYARALELVHDDAERRLIQRRLRELDHVPADTGQLAEPGPLSP